MPSGVETSEGIFFFSSLMIAQGAAYYQDCFAVDYHTFCAYQARKKCVLRLPDLRGVRIHPAQQLDALLAAFIVCTGGDFEHFAGFLPVLAAEVVEADHLSLARRQ